MSLSKSGAILQSNDPVDPYDKFQPRIAARARDICCNEIVDGNGSDWKPRVDILEDGRKYLFEIDLPGMKRTHIKVLLERNVLFITGMRHPGSRGAGGKRLRLERPSGYFVRRFELPRDACRGGIRAQMADGVLRLRVPKRSPLQKEHPRPQRIDVKVT